MNQPVINLEQNEDDDVRDLFNHLENDFLMVANRIFANMSPNRMDDDDVDIERYVVQPDPMEVFGMHVFGMVEPVVGVGQVGMEQDGMEPIVGADNNVIVGEVILDNVRQEIQVPEGIVHHDGHPQDMEIPVDGGINGNAHVVRNDRPLDIEIPFYDDDGIVAGPVIPVVVGDALTVLAELLRQDGVVFHHHVDQRGDVLHQLINGLEVQLQVNHVVDSDNNNNSLQVQLQVNHIGRPSLVDLSMIVHQP